MSKKVLVVLVGFCLLLGAALVMAQEGAWGPAGRRGPGGGRPQFGPAPGPMGEWFDNLTKAYEQKDMNRIGQLIEQIKQGRQGFAGRMGRGGPGGPPRGFGGFAPGASQGGSQPFLDSAPIAKTTAEKKILSVLDEMAKDRGRLFANVSPTDGRLLRQLTEAVGAKRVIEIGTSTGYSGLWFAMALRTTGGKLITHEIDLTRAAAARDNFEKAGVDDLITIVEDNAHETVKQQRDPIDILFLDADKEGYVDYLNTLLPLIRPGGLIIAHNMNTRQADQKYVEAITTNSGLETLLLLREGTGVGVTLKKR